MDQLNDTSHNKSYDHYHKTTPSYSSSSGWLEIRLFYVTITPCAINNVPQHLTLRNLGHEIGASLEINGLRIASSNSVLVPLRKDRVDKQSLEVTYVSTDNIRVTGPIEFEVIIDDEKCRNDRYKDIDMILLCGSLEGLESNGSLENGNKDYGLKPGWSMDVYAANLSKFGNGNGNGCSPSIEVYIAGWYSGVPVILTKTIQVSPRRKGCSRQLMLDAIPEDEEIGKGMVKENGVARQRKLLHIKEEADEYELERKVVSRYYSEGMYYDEDGQLTWFNAGVRVGVGIGLGMCLGVGIGVGLLMCSYQATTRNFRRRFF